MSVSIKAGLVATREEEAVLSDHMRSVPDSKASNAHLMI